MRDPARIQSCIDILSNLFSQNLPADKVLVDYYRNHRYMGSHDKRMISDLFYQVLRHYYRLNYLIQSYLKNPRAHELPRALVLAYLEAFAHGTFGLTQDLFNGETYAPSPLTREEKGALKIYQEKSKKILSQAPLWVKYECPEELFGSLSQKWGDQITQELEAFLSSAPTDVRVNLLKTTRDKVLKELKDFKPEKLESPWGIRFHGRIQLLQHPLYLEGAIEIQEEGSQLLSLLTQVKPGDKVIDLCAGGGGKTLAMAAMMENKGHIIACDIHEKRLNNAIKRLRKAGVSNTRCITISAQNDPWLKRHQKYFDKVVIDVPCSGTGTWRRNPESKFKKLGPNLDELLTTQQNLLQQAARLVKEDGYIIYMTCSILPEENQMQIEKFLALNSDFELMPPNLRDSKAPRELLIPFPILNQGNGCKAELSAAYTKYVSESESRDNRFHHLIGGTGISDRILTKDHLYLELSPHKSKTDGFFGAVLQKKRDK